MNKYILSTLCVFSSMNGMLPEETQQVVKREPREWDAQAYAQGNKMQEMGAIQFLQESGIDFTGKTVLDICCGTGNITAKIAESAKKIHGVDASKNMIEYAQKTYVDKKNLSFEHCFAQDITTKKPFNIALTFFCLHWIEEKQQTLEKINRTLTINGEFFGTYNSTSDPKNFLFTILEEVIPGFSYLYSFANATNLIDLSDYFITSDEEFQGLLSKTGFEIISYQQKSFDIVMSKKDMEYTVRPVVMSRPFMKKIPQTIREWFFTKFFDSTIQKLQQKEDGNYVIPATLWGTKVFHARKIADI